jgi:hypothetical protein
MSTAACAHFTHAFLELAMRAAGQEVDNNCVFCRFLDPLSYRIGSEPWTSVPQSLTAPERR